MTLSATSDTYLVQRLEREGMPVATAMLVRVDRATRQIVDARPFDVETHTTRYLALMRADSRGMVLDMR